VASDNARFGQPEVNLGLLPGYGGHVKYAQFLHDHSEVIIKPAQNTDDVVLALPVHKPLYEIPVVELTLQ